MGKITSNGFTSKEVAPGVPVGRSTNVFCVAHLGDCNWGKQLQHILVARRPALSGRDGRGKTSRGRAAACSSKMSELAALVRLRSSARVRYDVKDEDSAFFIIDNLRLWPFRYI